MDDRDGSATAQYKRLKSRLGGSEDHSESSDKPFWKRYGFLFQLLAVVGAFGSIIASAASTAIERTTSLVRASGPELLDTVFLILVGVTLIAVAVCLVVVALGARNI